MRQVPMEILRYPRIRVCRDTYTPRFGPFTKGDGTAFAQIQYGDGHGSCKQVFVYMGKNGRWELTVLFGISIPREYSRMAILA
jgi:hypothetical protein